MIGFTVITLLLGCFLYFNNIEKEKEVEEITVVTKVEDVLSASNYKGEQIYTLKNNREYLGEFKLTAYCGCWNCSEGYGNGTATGTIAQPDYTIAVWRLVFLLIYSICLPFKIISELFEELDYNLWSKE